MPTWSSIHMCSVEVRYTTRPLRWSGTVRLCSLWPEEFHCLLLLLTCFLPYSLNSTHLGKSSKPRRKFEVTDIKKSKESFVDCHGKYVANFHLLADIASDTDVILLSTNYWFVFSLLSSGSVQQKASPGKRILTSYGLVNEEALPNYGDSNCDIDVHTTWSKLLR